MKINKESNIYTIIYIVVLVELVGSALAYTSISLKDKQQENMAVDKMRQILASIHVVPDKGAVISDFNRYITDSYVVNNRGERIDGDAFGINVAAQSKLPSPSRHLPVYEATMPDGARKYILPVYGAGLWGPIWGYVALDADGSTIFGAYFAHQGETPGLGAEIEKAAFSDQFDGKRLVKGGELLPVNVLKQGQQPMGGEDYVDAISGGTITSKGVASMLDNCLQGYKAFLATLAKADTDNNDNAQ